MSSCGVEDIQAFEAEAGVVLPDGYKEFCQVFGSGMFGEEIRLYCPCRVKSAHIREVCWSAIASLKQDVALEIQYSVEGQSSLDVEKMKSLAVLLDSAFAFGDTPSAEILLWDVISYDETDKSYDIYIVPMDALERFTRIGRDFFEFVRDFCLNAKANLALLQADYLSKNIKLNRSFICFAETPSAVGQHSAQGSEEDFAFLSFQDIISDPQLSSQSSSPLSLVNPVSLGQPRGYSNGVLQSSSSGRLLFIAGQIGWDEQQNIVSSDFVEQFARALANVIEVVREAGGTTDGIARLVIYVTDKNEYRVRQREVGDKWRAVMGRHFPAMGLVEVKSLLEDNAKVEIEGIAVIQ